MRSLLVLLCLALFTSQASAQLIAIHFKDAKAASRHKDHLLRFKGEDVLVGEAWSNITVDLDKNTIGRTDANNNYMELLCADPSDPSKLPFKGEGDERKITNGKLKVGFSAEEMSSFSMYMREGSIAGLAADYNDRKELIDGLKAARDKEQKGSPGWMTQQNKMLAQLERLHSWLSSSVFPDAADKLEKELIKERKVVSAEATAARLASARASVKDPVEAADLTKFAANVNATHKFKMVESRHGRIFYREGIDDTRAKELLVMTEEIIDGWRVEFVDPYLDAGYEDYIEEKVLSEWFLDYDDITLHEKYLSGYYRMGWDPKRKEESLQAAGHGMQRSAAPYYLHTWRVDDAADLEGMIAHNLGHDLANIHFDKRRQGMEQDWLNEGVGLYVSLEWLGRNSVNCKGWSEPGKYVNTKKKAEGEKTPQIGLRDWYNTMALQAGAPIEKLALRTLFEMGDGDLAKSWSFFDWLAKTGGKQGQLFLRACCNTARTRATFINDWRAKAEEIFEMVGKNVFGAVEGKWKEYAETSQDTGDTKKK